MLQTIESINNVVNNFIWGVPAMICIIGVGLYLSLRTGFVQIRKFPYAIKTTIGRMFRKKDASDGTMTPFQAVCTALAATVGTGNIAGVAGAIAIGGPGAVFWMWCSALLGMCTKFSEVTLAVYFRERNKNGELVGGPMYYIKNGLGQRWQFLAVLYSLFGVLTVFGTGNATQVNTIVTAIDSAVLAYNTSVKSFLPTLNLIVGVVVAMLVAMVLLGGIKRIGSVTEKLVPFMALFYVVLAVGVVVLNVQRLPYVLESIVAGAFNPAAFTGGTIGSLFISMQKGVSRGIFSNESGMGSAPLVAASATTKNPARQALVSMTGTFWDTVVVCLITGLMLMTTLIANPELSTAVANGTISSGAGLATAAFEKIPVFGPLVLLVGLLTFTYSTILGWSQYGNRAISYLLGKKAVLPYYIVFLLFVFWGCMMVGDATGSAAVSNLSSVVWNFADVMNALMAIPNCIAVLGLSAIIARETKHYVYDGNLDEVDDTEIPQYDEK